MAAKDNTVIQGSLIVCIIFLVLSLAGNFFSWQYGDTQASAARQAKESADKALQEVRNKTDLIAMMKTMIGVGEPMDGSKWDALVNSQSADPEVGDLEKLFVQDMALFGPEVSFEGKSYRQVPKYLMQTLRQRNESETQQTQQANGLRAEKDQILESTNRRIKVAEQSKNDLQGTLNTERDQANKEREEKRQEMERINTLKDKQALVFGNQIKTLKNDLNASKKQSQTLQSTIESQKERLNSLTKDEFESPQGKVTLIHPDGKKVNIDLGAADLLRTGIIFGVVNPDDVRVSNAKPKAHLEVVRVYDGHLAEARIVDVNRGALISKGDPIYTPFWEPGRRVKVALAGMLDINEDNRDDQNEVKQMIESAGAHVVAQMSPSGIKIGDLDKETRFLVVGGEPTILDNEDPDIAEAKQQMLKSLGEFKYQAKELGITVISLNKLLGWLRTLSDAKTVPLGSQARGEDFQPSFRPSNVAPKGSLSDFWKGDQKVAPKK
jgi:type II secretory pathway pseudopilin PulG